MTDKIILNPQNAWIEEKVKYSHTDFEMKWFRVGYRYKDRNYYSGYWDSKWLPDIREALQNNEKSVFVNLVKVIKMELENQIADYEDIYLPED